MNSRHNTANRTSGALFIYIGLTAFILGCCMVMYAPDIAARWPL